MSYQHANYQYHDGPPRPPSIPSLGQSRSAVNLSAPPPRHYHSRSNHPQRIVVNGPPPSKNGSVRHNSLLSNSHPPSAHLQQVHSSPIANPKVRRSKQHAPSAVNYNSQVVSSHRQQRISHIPARSTSMYDLNGDNSNQRQSLPYGVSPQRSNIHLQTAQYPQRQMVHRSPSKRIQSVNNAFPNYPIRDEIYENENNNYLYDDEKPKVMKKTLSSGYRGLREIDSAQLRRSSSSNVPMNNNYPPTHDEYDQVLMTPTHQVRAPVSTRSVPPKRKEYVSSNRISRSPGSVRVPARHPRHHYEDPGLPRDYVREETEEELRHEYSPNRSYYTNSKYDTLSDRDGLNDRYEIEKEREIERRVRQEIEKEEELERKRERDLRKEREYEIQQRIREEEKERTKAREYKRDRERKREIERENELKRAQELEREIAKERERERELERSIKEIRSTLDPATSKAGAGSIFSTPNKKEENSERSYSFLSSPLSFRRMKKEERNRPIIEEDGPKVPLKPDSEMTDLINNQFILENNMDDASASARRAIEDEKRKLELEKSQLMEKKLEMEIRHELALEYGLTNDQSILGKLTNLQNGGDILSSSGDRNASRDAGISLLSQGTNDDLLNFDFDAPKAQYGGSNTLRYSSSETDRLETPDDYSDFVSIKDQPLYDPSDSSYTRSYKYNYSKGSDTESIYSKKSARSLRSVKSNRSIRSNRSTKSKKKSSKKDKRSTRSRSHHKYREDSDRDSDNAISIYEDAVESEDDYEVELTEQKRKKRKEKERRERAKEKERRERIKEKEKRERAKERERERREKERQRREKDKHEKDKREKAKEKERREKLKEKQYKSRYAKDHTRTVEKEIPKMPVMRPRRFTEQPTVSSPSRSNEKLKRKHSRKKLAVPEPKKYLVEEEVEVLEEEESDIPYAVQEEEEEETDGVEEVLDEESENEVQPIIAEGDLPTDYDDSQLLATPERTTTNVYPVKSALKKNKHMNYNLDYENSNQAYIKLSTAENTRLNAQLTGNQRVRSKKGESGAKASSSNGNGSTSPTKSKPKTKTPEKRRGSIVNGESKTSGLRMRSLRGDNDMISMDDRQSLKGGWTSRFNDSDYEDEYVIGGNQNISTVSPTRSNSRLVSLREQQAAYNNNNGAAHDPYANGKYYESEDEYGERNHGFGNKLKKLFGRKK